MAANKARKRIIYFMKLISFLHWILGFQIIEYSNNTFSIKGSKRVVYPAIIMSLYAYYAVTSMMYEESDVSTPMYILRTADVSLSIVELLEVMFTLLLDYFYVSKRTQLYTNLNQSYSEIFQSEQAKFTTIKRIFHIYLLNVVCSVIHYINYFNNSDVRLSSNMIIMVRSMTADFMVLQHVVELYLCKVGFYSLNESLSNFSWVNANTSNFSKDVDFQTFRNYSKSNTIEWIEKTSKRGANLQTLLNVYDSLLGCVDFVISRFGIMVRKNFYRINT